MPQEPKSPVSELKPAELRTIVGDIQKLLWFYVDRERVHRGDKPEDAAFWNGDNDWSLDTLDCIAAVLDERELCPIDPPTFTGFRSTATEGVPNAHSCASIPVASLLTAFRGHWPL
jgi:hypothetical protein